MANTRVGVAAVVVIAVIMIAQPLRAQGPQHINIYRYILDMDVPEPAALVALDATPSRVLRGSMPKPFSAHLLAVRHDTAWRSGAALEVAPYYVFGSGVRSVAAHRDMSVAGRLMRVLTKTTVSIAAMPSANSSGTDLGIGVRSTLHDPHDPTTATALPELVDSVLRANGVNLPATETDLRALNPELRRLFADARRAMRARSGDVQVAAGWGMARFADANGKTGDWGAHTLWLTAQNTRGPRTDILATMQVLDAFDSARSYRIGAGLQLKSSSADLRTELSFDSHNRRVRPSVAVETHMVDGMGAVAAIGPGERITTLVRWYYVSKH